ncbi:hypothetical protein DQ04_01901150 [Trypanosoma grayi]|uniref:hypothetical protein n=1 Tax=Trypanosoma grayi TaxID=71804 RepID=UPI0004F47776|nr:hypothetical protein DQ04_01901150 [Trypanosoma grayi]KEG12209.1 hypothetical protein DQ04_01901150 [Trypanosoma grayi]
MVVLRLIGDEWSWEDRIALAVPPQRIFTMCIPLLVAKLGLEKWDGLMLYRTEGKPPKYCRPTTALDMSSNPQRERLRDGAVLWVRVAPSRVQQEYERVFQRSLEDWREKNGLKGVTDDGSDVKRFVEELNSRLNASDAKDLDIEEKRSRDAIEGVEHRLFSHMTFTCQEGKRLEFEEAQKRESLETAFALAIQQHYKSFLLPIRRESVAHLCALEGECRRAIYEAQDEECAALRRQMVSFSPRAVRQESPLKSNAKAEPNNFIRDINLTQIRENSVAEYHDAENLRMMVRAEFRKLLEPMEQMYRKEIAMLQTQRDDAASGSELFLARLGQYITSALHVIQGEVLRPQSFLSSQLPVLSTDGVEALQRSLEQQQRLLRELLRKYRDLEVRTSIDLHNVGARTTLTAIHVAQLNMCRYLEYLHEQLCKNQAPWKNLMEINERLLTDITRVTQENMQLRKLQKKHGAPHITSTNVHCEVNCHKGRVPEVHTDTYNILLGFVSRCLGPLGVDTSNATEFVSDLLLQTGSVQAASDELCLACSARAHPMRRFFVSETEVYTPHLCAVVDIMLHLYAGREMELLLWIRPELASQGSFDTCLADDGSMYYYHTAIGMSQWIQPASLMAT